MQGLLAARCHQQAIRAKHKHVEDSAHVPEVLADGCHSEGKNCAGGSDAMLFLDKGAHGRVGYHHRQALGWQVSVFTSSFSEPILQPCYPNSSSYCDSGWRGRVSVEMGDVVVASLRRGIQG